MALSTRATTSLACQGCRQWILRSVIASIGGSPMQECAAPQRRAFSAPAKRWNEARERLQKENRGEHALNDINHEFSLPTSSPTSKSAAKSPPRESTQQEPDVPWYLQGESPMPRQESVLSARQKIPGLPDHAPPILESLLERVSVELGMDDLSLLDLRGIDPPPALGANLLMIFGTARSEKHLHFSADKLCRWLRTEHRLTPYADGLLGRQEMKLKIKRRAKRSRLLSAVGGKSTAESELDEGIRTGWICVNLGKVEGGDLPKTEQELEAEKNIVGFGTRTSGSHVVVQLMTEEKRGELELERVWMAVLKMSRRGRDAIFGKENETTSEAPTPMSHDDSPRTAAPNATMPGKESNEGVSTAYDPVSFIPGRQQARAFHTSARRLYAAPMTSQTSAGTMSEVQSSITSTNLDRIPDSAESLSTLSALLKSFEDMPPSDALRALGDAALAPPNIHAESHLVHNNPENTNSTPFLDDFYNAMPPFPGRFHWHAHVRLLCQARRLGHQHTDDVVVLSALQHMHIAGLVPLEKTYFTVLQTLLLKDFNRDSVDYQQIMAHILDLLEEMETHGYNALRPEILELLHRVLVGPPPSSPPMTLQSVVPALGLARLKRHIASNDINGFWRTWHSYPRRLLSRDAELYVVLFDAFANGNLGSTDFHQIREVLSTCIGEMESEQPPVKVENESVQLTMAIFKALRFADPYGTFKEWDGVRKRCESVLRTAIQR